MKQWVIRTPRNDGQYTYGWMARWCNSYAEVEKTMAERPPGHTRAKIVERDLPPGLPGSTVRIWSGGFGEPA